jgi:hypothetical protein
MVGKAVSQPGRGAVQSSSALVSSESGEIRESAHDLDDRGDGGRLHCERDRGLRYAVGFTADRPALAVQQQVRNNDGYRAKSGVKRKQLIAVSPGSR